MSRKHLLTAGLVAAALLGVVLIGKAVLVGTPRRPMTVTQADALVRRGIPANASVRHVSAWLDAQHIEHGHSSPDHVAVPNEVIFGLIRDTARPSAFISADIQFSFTFDKQHRLMAYSSREIWTGL